MKKQTRRRRGLTHCLLLALLFLPVICSWMLIPAAYSSEQESPDQRRLNNLKIQGLKRELRLSLQSQKTGTDAALFKLYEVNHFEEIVQTIKKHPSNKKSAARLLLYGNSLFFLGRMEEAVSAYQQAFRVSVSPQEKGAAMSNFSLVFSTAGRWKEAVDWLEKTLEIDRQADYWKGQGISLSLLGSFYYQLGNTEKGAAAHIEALEIAETIPIPWLEARQLIQLGNLYYLDQTFHLARNYFEKAVVIYRKLDDPLGEAGALTALSFVYKDLKTYDKALDLQSEALALYHELNDFGNASKALLNLSLIYRDQGHFQKALDSAEKALKFQKHIRDLNRLAERDLNRLAEIEGTMGTIYQKKGDLSKAIGHLETARDYFHQAGASQQIHIVDLRIQALQDQIE